MVFSDEKNSFSLLSEWQLLFADEKVDDVKLQKYCINGCLGNSHIRSLVWRIVLKVLPMRKSEWVRGLKRTREIYKGLQMSLNFDPRIIQTTSDADSCIINPLSLHRANPWCQFFEDKRLRELIDNDVRRTSPDIPFFQCRQIKELMSNVLFAYTKSHPKMSYRQGMHELLAPILFVLDCDQKIYQHLQDREYFSSYAASEFSTEDLRILEMLNNPEFLEHDAYSIFCKLMDLVEVFYLTKNDVSEDENSNNSNGRQCIRPRTQSSTAFIFRDHLIRVPFAKESEQDLSELNKRLENIHDVLLTAVDPTLARHLNSLQILPQVYGIRWLRLLFGREFTLLDLLSVWDLIIGAENSHEMIDYVFLALLVQIRQSLLHADYITCMHYLMKYTPVKDVNTFIRFVLYLKYPNKYPIPENMASFAQFVHPGRFAARTEWIWAKNSLSPPLEEETTNNQRRPAVKRLRRQALAAYPSSLSIRRGGEETTNSSSVSVTHDSSSERSHSQQNKRKSIADSPKRKSSSIPSTQKISPQHLESNGEIELMKEQISLLQSRLNDVDFIGQISAQQIRKCADEARMETPEGRRKLVEELKEVADQLTRSTVSEHFIMQHMQPPPAVPEGNRAEAVELASEVLGFQATTPSSTAAAASSNDAQTRSRLSSKTLQSSNEMIELRFDRKKNF